jgi:hypothetical protein
MSILIFATIVIGIALISAGAILRGRGSRASGGALIATGLLLQSWWVLLVALVLFKFLVLREDT